MLAARLPLAKVESLTPERFTLEAGTGKLVRFGLDRRRRPVLYMRPRLQNTKEYEEQTAFTIYTLERMTHAMAAHEGVEQLCLVIDYKDYSLWNAPPLAQTKEILHVITHHYPERLGDAFMVNAPYLFHMVYKMVSPLIPPATRAKVRVARDQAGRPGAGEGDARPSPRRAMLRRSTSATATTSRRR